MFRLLFPSSALFLMSAFALVFFPFPGLSEKNYLFQISDIHGDYEALVWLIRHLIIGHVKKGNKLDPKTDKFVFTGDVTDRGPKSIECYRLIHELMDGRRNDHGFKISPKPKDGSIGKKFWDLKHGVDPNFLPLIHHPHGKLPVFEKKELKLDKNHPDAIPTTALLGNHEFWYLFLKFEEARATSDRDLQPKVIKGMYDYVSKADTEQFGDPPGTDPAGSAGEPQSQTQCCPGCKCEVTEDTRTNREQEWAKGGSLGRFVEENFDLVALESITYPGNPKSEPIAESRTLFIHADFRLNDQIQPPIPVDEVLSLEQSESVIKSLNDKYHAVAKKFRAGGGLSESTKADLEDFRLSVDSRRLKYVQNFKPPKNPPVASKNPSKYDLRGDVLEEMWEGISEVEKLLPQFQAARLVVGHNTGTLPMNHEGDHKTGFPRFSWHRELLEKLVFTDVGMSRWMRIRGPRRLREFNADDTDIEPAYPSVLVMESGTSPAPYFKVYFKYAKIKKQEHGGAVKWMVADPKWNEQQVNQELAVWGTTEEEKAARRAEEWKDPDSADLGPDRGIKTLDVFPLSAAGSGPGADGVSGPVQSSNDHVAAATKLPDELDGAGLIQPPPAGGGGQLLVADDDGIESFPSVDLLPGAGVPAERLKAETVIQGLSSFSQITTTEGVDPSQTPSTTNPSQISATNPSQISATKGVEPSQTTGPTADPSQTPSTKAGEASQISSTKGVEASQKLSLQALSTDSLSFVSVCAGTLGVTLVSLAALRVWGRLVNWEDKGPAGVNNNLKGVDSDQARGVDSESPEARPQGAPEKPSKRDTPESSERSPDSEESGSGSQEPSNDGTEVADSESGSR